MRFPARLGAFLLLGAWGLLIRSGPLRADGGPAPATPVPENRAVLVVHLPEDATLEINGVEIQLTGPVRRVRTAPLVPGKAYSYPLRVTWKDRDEVKVVQRDVDIRAAQEVTVRIDEAAATGPPEEGAGAELAACALGRFLLTLQRLEPLLGGSIDRLVVSPDLRYAVTRAGTIRLWDVAACRELRRLPDVYSGYGAFTPTFSPDGRRLAYLVDGSTVTVHDIRMGKDVATLTGKAPCGCAAFSPDGQLLATGHGHGGILVREVDSQKVTLQVTNFKADTRTYYETYDGPTVLAFTPNGKALLASFGSSFVKPTMALWDLATNQLRHELPLPSKSAHVLGISPDSKRAIGRGDDGEVFVFDLESGKELPATELRNARPVLEALARALPGSPGPTPCDLGRYYVELKRLEWLAGPFPRFHVSPSGRFVVADHGRIQPPESGTPARAGDDDLVRVWDVKERRETARLPEFRANGPPAFSADGHRLAYAARDRTVRVWDAQAGAELRRLEGKWGTDKPPHDCNFSADGRHLLVSGSFWDGQTTRGWVELWDLDTGQFVRRYDGLAGITARVAFMPDARQFLVGGADYKIRLYDIGSGKEVGSFSGHVDSVSGFLIAPDGRRILSGSADGTVRLWDTESGHELNGTEWQTPWVRGAFRSASGQEMLTGGREVPGPHNTPVARPSGSGGGPSLIRIR